MVASLQVPPLETANGPPVQVTVGAVSETVPADGVAAPAPVVHQHSNASSGIAILSVLMLFTPAI